jgi:hypothetical protein
MVRFGSLRNIVLVSLELRSRVGWREPLANAERVVELNHAEPHLAQVPGANSVTKGLGGVFGKKKEVRVDEWLPLDRRRFRAEIYI